MIWAALLLANPSPFFIPHFLIPQITCHGKDGSVRGSGSFIESDQVLTAAHVTWGRKCEIAGHPVETVYESGKLDLAVLKTPFRAPWRMTVSCVPVAKGTEVYATGYADGEWYITQRYTWTGVPVRSGEFGGLTITLGNAYPGMSGGPVVNRDGQVVGILNATNAQGLMLSRAIRDSYLCP